MIAQRVSAGFHPRMKSQPRQGRQNPFTHERRSAIASPSLDNAPEDEADKRQSLKAAKKPIVADLESRWFHRSEYRSVSFHQRRPRPKTDPRPCPSPPPFVPFVRFVVHPPPLFNHEVHQRHETDSHAETPSPPRLEYPSSRIPMTGYLRPDTDTVAPQTPLLHTADEAGFPSAFSASLRETTP